MNLKMTKKVFTLLGLLLFASTILSAQTPGFPAAGGHWVPISAGLAMAIASSFCGLAQGKATASAVEAMARNPGAAAAIRLAMIIGLALIESLALYTLIVVFSFAK